MALRKRVFPIVAALLVLIATIVYVWYVTGRMSSLHDSLQKFEQRAQVVERKMTEYSREVDRQIAMAREARTGMEAAKHDAAESAAAREAAVAQAQAAEGVAQQAQVEARQAKTELSDLRRKREQEIERMQEALSQIAPTRRTALGLVVELASDSFKFDFDKSDLKAENRELLSRIAGVLLASSGYRLFVYGHTDDIGGAEYNQGLSERRANSVADYLIRAGVPTDIVTRKGYGKSSPRAKGASDEARRQNRRVEIGIVDTVIQYDPRLPPAGR